MSRARALALALLALLAPASAFADPEGDLGLSPRIAALGGAVGASPGEPAVVAYNPAALVGPGDPDGVAELSLSFALAAPALFAESLEPGRELDLDAPPNTYALTAAARFDVGRPVGLPGLVLGLAFYAPVEALVRSSIRPDDAPSWLLLGDRTLHVGIHVGLAYRVVDWLTVGVGARVIFDEQAYITGAAEDVRRVTDPVTGEERVEAGTRLGVSSSIYGHAAPTLGVLVSPLPTLRFAFAWRGRLVSDDWGWSRLQGIEAVGDLGFVHRFTHVYRPDELAWSLAWRAHDALEVSAELTWLRWSEARSPNHAALVGRFGDTLVPALGVRATPLAGLDLLAGYRYAHRPYDDLGGPTNLLTNDTHHVGLGLELDLARLFPAEGVPITLSLAGRLGILEDRVERKDGRRFANDRAYRENPGTPGYRYGGLVPSAQLGAEVAW